MTQGRLIIMRHGQTEYNVKKMMTGHTDVDLTDVGVQQGKEAGKLLKQFNIHAAYASPLKRAIQTLELAFDAAGSHKNLKTQSGWNIKIRKSLIEKDVGDMAGVCHKSDPRMTNRVWQYDVPLPNGESDKQVVERVRKFYEEELLPQLKEGKTIAISCHSGVKRAFMVVLGHITSDQIMKVKAPNAMPWVVDFKDGKVKSHRFCTPSNDNKGKGPKPS